MTVLVPDRGGDKIRLTWLRKSSYTKNAWFFFMKYISWNNYTYMYVHHPYVLHLTGEVNIHYWLYWMRKSGGWIRHSTHHRFSFKRWQMQAWYFTLEGARQFVLDKGHLCEAFVIFYWNISKGTEANTRGDGGNYLRCLCEASDP